MSKPKTGMARQALTFNARARAFRESRLAKRSVHTESLPSVRRFTSSPYEGYVIGNRRVF
jgi:hypothetical protein